MSARRIHRRLLATAVVMSLVAGATVSIVPAASAGTSCRVKNLGTNVTKRSLQAAVTAATGGATLQVRGRCVGGTTINKHLTILGKRTEATGKPILDGDDATRVLWVRVGKQVSIKGLTIRDGLAEGAYPADSGGGIRNDGTLTLRDVIVRNSEAYNGGGVSTSGRLILKGATQVAYNQADLNNGGGVDVDSTDRDASLVMRDSSSIHHNSAYRGGGVHIWIGSATLHDDATIHHNTADIGAGVADTGSLTMNDSSAVRHNTVRSGDYGGGVEVWSPGGDLVPTFTMTGPSRVRNNTAGPLGGGVMSWPDCGAEPVLSGVNATRVVDNVPADGIVEVTGC